MKKSPKKAVRRRPVAPSGPYCGFTEIEARARLHRKIIAVCSEMPEVPTTGKTTDNKNGEVFQFTEYRTVQKAVVPLLIKHRLTFTPYADPAMLTTVQHHGLEDSLVTYFALTDCDTGYQMIVPGQGKGSNAWWALDSAGTLALKHSQLQSLMIYWENKASDEEVVKQHVMRAQEQIVEAVAESLLGRTRAEASRTAKDELLQFFGGTNAKPESNYVRHHPAAGQGGRGKPRSGPSTPGEV